MGNNILHLASVPAFGTLYAKYKGISGWENRLDHFLLQSQGDILVDTLLGAGVSYTAVWVGSAVLIVLIGKPKR